MGERARIAQYFAPLAAAEAGSFSLTDDAAVLTPPAGQQLVITTDSVIEGIHIMQGATPQQCAQKLMRRNLSDLAAMGATPWRYTLNLHTPTALQAAWYAAFAACLKKEQERFGLILIGGDSTSGGTNIHTTLTCFGLLNRAPLRRHGAAAGDDLYVSGTVGDAAYALYLLQRDQPVSDALAAHYHCPEPRLMLGQMLHGISSSVIDISDGLLTDTTQLADASRCHITVERDALPLGEMLQAQIIRDASAWRFALSGGDDYELCFTAAPSQRESLEQIAQQLHLPLTRIGSVSPGQGISLRAADGSKLPITRSGYEHA